VVHQCWPKKLLSVLARGDKRRLNQFGLQADLDAVGGVGVMTIASQILSESLRQVTDDYPDRLAVADSVTLASRAQHFASVVHFCREQPAAMRRLHRATGGFINADGLEGLLGRVLDGAIALTGADFGNLQLMDPTTGALRIVAQSGFDADFLDYFAVVGDTASACGRAATSGKQIVIADTGLDPVFAPHRAVAEVAGVRAVQSTPLLTCHGELVGVVSTHQRYPHIPSDRQLWMMELFSDAAGEAIAKRLDTTRTVDDIGEVLVSALLIPSLAPTDGITSASAVSRAALAQTDGSAEDGFTCELQEPPSMQERVTVPEFAQDIIEQLFTVGLNLSAADGLIKNARAGELVLSTIASLDETIRWITASTFEVIAGDPNARIDE
jgi:GAF domain